MVVLTVMITSRMYDVDDDDEAASSDECDEDDEDAGQALTGC